MRVLVAGASGVVGRRLVPQLVARGHQVTATTTSAAKVGLLERLGATGVVMDGLDATSVGEAVAAARPDAIVHEMTGLSLAHAGKPDLRHPDRFFATTIRLRTEGTDHLLAAAEATGVSHRRRAELWRLRWHPRGWMGEDRGRSDGPRPDEPAQGD
jgi:nucleoside-diphosphate-sugar epimerase